jgi:hypothetical protein
MVSVQERTPSRRRGWDKGELQAHLAELRAALNFWHRSPPRGAGSSPAAHQWAGQRKGLNDIAPETETKVAIENGT